MTESISKSQMDGRRLFLEKIGYSKDISEVEVQRVLDIALSNRSLTQREIEILRERYLGENAKCTYLEAGTKLGCTPSNVRQLEEKAFKKMKHQESSSMSERHIARSRLSKLIPTLEYDVLYDPSSIAQKLKISRQNLSHGINHLAEEFDLSLIRTNSPSGKRYILRIGEQYEDLPIPSQPLENPCESQPQFLNDLSPEEYNTRYLAFWEKIASRIKSLGYSSSRFDYGNHNPELRYKVFKDFMRDSMLPVAVNQDYRIGFREPLVVYHPKILREVRKK